MTKYCPKISILSCLTWKYLSDVFSYKLKVSELGITNHLVFDITNFYNGFSSGSKVYCFHAKNEKQRGADIDLFIQNSSGMYNHFMIQAKVMDYRGYYNDISKWSPNAQFLTLIKKAKKEKALALYLLYNGRTPKSMKGSDSLGLSIIPAKDIRDFRYRQWKTTHKHGQNSLYFDLLSKYMEPYFNLFCGGIQNMSPPPDKKENEIYTDFPYTLISKNNNVEREIINEKEATQKIKRLNLAPIRIIIKYDENLIEEKPIH